MSKNSGVQTKCENALRKLAGHTSRRGLLSKLGLTLVAAPLVPVLPVSRAWAAKDRTAQAKTTFARLAKTTDDTKCDYWRYCAIDGALCSCCGGNTNTCPPGTEPSPTSWIGTCINPEDGRAYLIAYRDCCGTAYCGRCACDNTDRATETSHPQTNNSIIWCFGTASMEYHCSLAALVGVAE